MDGLHVRKTHHIGLALAECSVSVLEYSKRQLKHNESLTFFRYVHIELVNQSRIQLTYTATILLGHCGAFVD